MEAYILQVIHKLAENSDNLLGFAPFTQFLSIRLLGLLSDTSFYPQFESSFVPVRVPSGSVGFSPSLPNRPPSLAFFPLFSLYPFPTFLFFIVFGILCLLLAPLTVAR